MEWRYWRHRPTENPIQLTIIESKTVTATFEKKKYPLTVNIEGEGEVLEEIVNTGRTTDYDSGTTVKLTAQSTDEWLFTGWSGDIGDIDPAENPIQLTIIESKTVTATFEKKKYPLTVNIEGEGEVLEEIVNTGRTTDYDSGTTVKLTAQSTDEWLFTGWSGDIGDIDPTENPIQLTIIESKTVTATFEKKKYPLTVNIEGEGEVLEEIVNTGRTTDYDSGTTVKLTAQPTDEWLFTGWSGDIGDIDPTENPIQLTIIESKTVTATFEKKKYPLTVNIEGEGEVLEEIVNTGRTTDYDSGTTVKLTAQSTDEWLFTGWSGDIGDIDPTENPIQLTIIESKTVTATFEKKKYPLTVNIEGEGEVLEEIVNTGRTTDYDSGTTVKLTAVPKEGWVFVEWTGDLKGNINPQVLTVFQEKNVSASFVKKEQDVTAHDFMWKAMNLWYFWQADVADLSNTRFSNDQSYIDFLQAQGTPDEFYNSKLLFPEDRFSYLREDYKDLVQSFQGISKSNGLEFGLSLFANSENVYGYVRYIVPRSNAATADISRGEIFTGVDGQTLNLDNYQSLLFGDNTTYTLNMASIENNTIASNGKSVTLTKEEGLSENPIFLTKVIETNGIKVGYIVYNGFTSSYNEELNEAFGTLKAAGVTELVLDLRYNPGGSVNSSRLLASMIYGTDTSKLYIQQRWNSKIQALLSDSQLKDYFANSTGESPINTLNLPRVFIIATGSSASASELLINGLDPYMEVIHVGSTTRGKNEFSITLVDLPSNSFIYNADKASSINPKNSWGLQPLVGRNENAVGFYDYTSGFTPDYEIREELGNFSVFGNINEPLLSKALSIINGKIKISRSKINIKNSIYIEEIDNSKNHKLLNDRMLLDKKIEISQIK